MPTDARPPIVRDKGPGDDEADTGEAVASGSGEASIRGIVNTGEHDNTANNAGMPPSETALQGGLVQIDKDRIKAKAATAKLGPFGRPRSNVWRPGDPRRTWDLSNFIWYCSHCEEERGVQGASVDPAAKAQCVFDSTGEVRNSMDCKKDHGSAAMQPQSLSIPKPELTHGSRRVLKQYFELCTAPDRAQLSLLAAMTERSLADTQSWFHEKVLQRQREERQRLQQ